MKASLQNYRQSPRKVRLVGNLMKGKAVADAELELKALPKRAALPLMKLLQSAVANAVAQSGADKDALVVLTVRVDKGIVMKRFMPRAFGRASRINKRTSHVVIELREKNADTKKAPKAEKKEVSKTEKKPAAKKSTAAKKKVAAKKS